jgi:Flp pilus assembly protein TadG
MRPIESIRRFLKDERGAGTVFMLCMLPMFLALSGLAILGASAFDTQTVLQAAADSAALAGGAALPQGANAAQQAAINYAQMNLPIAGNGTVLESSDFLTGTWNSATHTFTPGGAAPNAVSVVLRRALSNSNALPTTFLSLIGIPTIDVAARSVVTANSAKLRVSLVLDNTGSMCQPDNQNPCPGDTNPNIKINALKTATTNLLKTLQGASAKSGDVTVAIVPFTTAVDVGAANYGASWLTWTDFDAVKPSTPSSNVGPGSTCPWSDHSDGYHCQASASSSTAVTTIPSSGTYSGYICPSDTSDYPGCFNSVSQGSHNGQTTYSHTWIPYHPDWSGCVMDRNQNYDVQNTLPTTGNTSTLFPAAPAILTTNSQWSLTCPTQLIGQTDVLDSTGWTNLNATVTAMQAGGATNQAIGLAWGWMLMTSGSPIVDPGALPKGTQDVIILLSDGLNTQDRWSGSGSSEDAGTDARMAAVCANAKAANPSVLIYTVFVDLNGTQGNSTVLQNCASSPSSKYYFDLTTSNEIITTFNLIGNELTKLRVVQ